MAIKVTKLDNLFWNNGSYEKPENVINTDTFITFDNLKVDWDSQKITGSVLLTGDWNYAFCEGQYYFLQRIKVADRDNNSWEYGLIKDYWSNWLLKEVKIKGYCTKTTDKKLLLDNLNYVTPAIDNPCKQLRLNLSDDINRHWYEELQIKRPTIKANQFTNAKITTKDWYLFIKDCSNTPVSDSYLNVIRDIKKDARYNRGVVIVGELKTDSEVSPWKVKVLKKINFLLDDIKDYSLSKVGNDERAGLGTHSSIKNKYVLTPTANGGIGVFEETAIVTNLDFSGLSDIIEITGIRSDSSDIVAEFEPFNLDEQELQRTYASLNTVQSDAEAKKYKVLQRKVYFPYLRKNWGTTNDYLYRAGIEPTLLSSARAQDTSVVTEFAEGEPLVPIYQGNFAQGLKSKTKPNENFYLPWTYQLDTTFNWKLGEYSTEQRQGSLNNKIAFYLEKNPPEFGLLVFGQNRKRKDWNWYHFTGEESNILSVITGLKEGWDKPLRATYDRDSGKWVQRVSKWWSNFQLLNSLYPYSWIYYFSALRDNKLKISFRDWEDWGTASGFFNKVNYKGEGEVDFSSVDIKALNQRTIDNNVLDLDYYDKARKEYFEKKVITENILLPKTIYEGDIFFSDLEAFWEEKESPKNDYRYANEIGWYLDTQENHRAEEKNYKKEVERPEIVFYWNNSLKKYQLGVYYRYKITHQLAKEDNDIQYVKFRENNNNTNNLLISAPDGVSEKTVNYHHIQQVRNEATKITESESVFNLVNFTAWAKKKEGKEILDSIDKTLAEIDRIYTKLGNQYLGGWKEPYTEKWKRYYGLENTQQLKTLPKIDNEYSYRDIFELFNVEDKWEINGPNYKEEQFNPHTPSSSAFYSPVDFWGERLSSRGQNNDVLIFGNKQWVAVSSFWYPDLIKNLRDKLRNQVRNLFTDINKYLGNVYTFDTVADFKKALNTKGLQKDIYKALNLIDSSGKYQTDIADINYKLYDLVGTGYWLWIGQDGTPHLVFKPYAVKSDINLKEKKVFRLPTSEIPSQDYIDAINQQTVLQVVNSQFPLQERLLFDNTPIVSIEDEELGNNDFKVIINRFSVENKSNPNDYFFIEYQGARQLLDIKLSTPKRTLAETNVSDIVAKTQLAFDQEKWREDYRHKVSLFKYEKELAEKEIGFKEEKLFNRRVDNIFDSGINLGTNFLNLTRPDHLPYAGASVFTKPVSTLYGIYSSVRDLSLQGRELESIKKATLGQIFINNAQLQTEHHYNRKKFLFTLNNLGNVYQQGEVNDRDITDEYNKQRNLNEVHLIYRIPSEVQREAIERLYSLYGVDCNIPEVEIKLNQLKRGSIWEFAFIDEYVNIWATEERDALKNTLLNGVKILETTRPSPVLVPEKPLSWQERIGELLQEADEEKKEILFNKLAIGINQIDVLKRLAEQVSDKNQLVGIIEPILDKVSLLAKLASTKDKKELTAFTLKILDNTDTDEIWNKLLENKDKERLIEEWIDNGSDLKRVLWDKYAEHTISKDEHQEKIDLKDATIENYSQELKECIKKGVELQNELGTSNSKLQSAQANLTRVSKDLQNTKERLLSTEREKGQILLEKENAIKEKQATNERYSQLSKSYRELEQTKQEETRLKNLYLDEKNKLAKEKSTIQNTLKEREEAIEELDKQSKECKAELSRTKEENGAQKLQIDKQLQQIKELEERPTGTLVDTHSNVDYLITKKDDKVVVTAWNKEKNIWVEQPDLVVKRRDQTKLLRIAYKDEKFVTNQYPFWSWYTNNHRDKFNITVSTFDVLDGYIKDTNIKQAHSWIGRYSVELDKNIPYLDANGNWVKPYWYHPEKGWFDYDIDGGQKISNYKEYLEINRVCDKSTDNLDSSFINNKGFIQLLGNKNGFVITKDSAGHIEVGKFNDKYFTFLKDYNLVVKENRANKLLKLVKTSKAGSYIPENYPFIDKLSWKNTYFNLDVTNFETLDNYLKGRVRTEDRENYVNAYAFAGKVGINVDANIPVFNWTNLEKASKNNFNEDVVSENGIKYFDPKTGKWYDDKSEDEFRIKVGTFKEYLKAFDLKWDNENNKVVSLSYEEKLANYVRIEEYQHLANLNGQFADDKEKLNKELEESEIQIKELEVTNTQCTQSNEALIERIKRLNALIKSQPAKEQIVELQTKISQLEQEKQELNKSLTAIREIDNPLRQQINKLGTSRFNSNSFLNLYTKPNTYLVEERTLITPNSAELIEWNNDLNILVVAFSKMPLYCKKLWGKGSYLGGGYDLGFFWKFDADLNWNNSNLRDFYIADTLHTDQRHYLNFSSSNLPTGVKQAKYIGSWNIITYEDIIQPILPSKKNVTINTRLKFTVWWDNNNKKWSKQEIRGALKITKYGEYLDALGLRLENGKVV